MIAPGSPGLMFAAALECTVLLPSLFAGSKLPRVPRSGLSSAELLTCRLWQPVVALAVAVGSFVLAPQKVLPVLLRGSPLQFLPVFLPLAGMLFWLARLRVRKAFVRLRNGPVTPATNLKAA